MFIATPDNRRPTLIYLISSASVVNSAKEQLLTDLANAKKNGISTKELLDALAAKRGI